MRRTSLTDSVGCSGGAIFLLGGTLMTPALSSGSHSRFRKGASKDHIATLVKSFGENEPLIMSSQEVEAQVEGDYIRPLFRYLNWNVDNEGLSPSDREFVLQQTDRRGRRPDYKLRLDGRDLMVMEAKKPRLSMHDPRWLHQVYGYAYSTQANPLPRRIDFGVLTDFQEFVVLDCHLKVDTPEAVQNLQVIDWRFRDYLDRFDELWELFERGNMLEASRTRDAGLWTRLLSPKEANAHRIPPDKAFLSALDDPKTGWRIRLAKDMKRLNPGLGGSVITAAVQLLIDRLLFTKALSDRDIEDDYLGQLSERLRSADPGLGWFNACKDIFIRLNDTYDGSVFAPRPELEAVAVSNKTLHSIIEEMQPSRSPYNFAAMPVEILGTIYERFLGRVVRATPQRVQIEDKPEVRKAGGVYYTPQYIVTYIVEQTLGRLLKKCRTPVDVAKLKVLDPACGSGSFLLGAYDVVVQWYRDYYLAKGISSRDRNSAYYDEDGGIRLTSRLKRQILLDNIYGVDIDPQAVEVTCFSLSLKALEDTRREELYEEVNLFQSRVLPDLTGNIKCGNSLIGHDSVYDDLNINDEDVRRRINAFDWSKGFSEIMRNGGFDAVIGNPPYIRIQRVEREEAAYFFRRYAIALGKMDESLLFIERALELSSPSGLVGFICTSQWMKTGYGRKLRERLADGTLRSIVDFGSLPVFESNTYPAVFVLSRKASPSLTLARVTDRADLSYEGIKKASSRKIEASSLTGSAWNLGALDIPSILHRGSLAWTPLKTFGNAQIGTLTGLDEAFVVSAETASELGLEKELLFPYAHRGAEVERFRDVEPQAVVIYPYREGPKGAPLLLSEVELRQYPQVHAHLLSFKEHLRKRMDSRKLYATGRDWYRHLRAGSFQYIRVPKLLYRGIAKRSIVGLLVADTAFSGANCPGVILGELGGHHRNYILGVLNSSLMSVHLLGVCPPKLGGYTRFDAQSINDAPIRFIDFSNAEAASLHEQIVEFVDRMLRLHSTLETVDTTHERDVLSREIESLDSRIDEVVFRLYGLTDGEQRVVEREKGSWAGDEGGSLFLGRDERVKIEAEPEEALRALLTTRPKRR
jgi:hypothetical protein